MKLKCFLLGVICLILIPTNLFSISLIGKNWNTSEDDRSLPSEPILSQDDNAIYIYSEKQLDNLCIEIKDLSTNEVVYSTVATIPTDTEYATSITSLPKGEYLFTITQRSKYMVGYFIK